MGRNSKKWENIPAGQHNPLAYAVTARDQSVLQMVDDAVRHKNVMLAYQSVVPSGQQDIPAFYEGLIRVLDDAGRVIPAGEFIDAVETQETGRLIDCLALEKGLRALLKYPGLRLSINMSARSIGYARWMRSLKRGLGQDDRHAPVCFHYQKAQNVTSSSGSGYRRRYCVATLRRQR